MNLLGLYGGRDASVVVLRDGVRAAYVLRERVTRQRHAAGICRAMVEMALAEAGLTSAEIDLCAVAMRAGRKPMLHDPAFLSVSDLTPFAPLNGGETGLGIVTHDTLAVTLDGRAIPGVKVRAHAAHAAAAYYPSGFKDALVFTHDGDDGFESGLVFHAAKGALSPLSVHGLAIAALYDAAARKCGLGAGSAGKLMGLSAYGKPAFDGLIPAGDLAVWRRVLALPTAAPDLVIEACLDALVSEAARAGYDLKTLGRADLLPSPLAADLAASVQKLFSDSLVDCLRLLHADMPDVRHLCLGGGAALNCPSNARLSREAGFETVFIPPHCDNSGLAIGAAWWAWHVVCGRKNKGADVARDSQYAMMGYDRAADVADAIGAFDDVEAVRCEDSATSAARDLLANKLVGWFEGGSETGPRALGHRSILADPRKAANAARVNAVKAREAWRPFAPACLAEAASDWFEGALPSPFMLFTHKVREAKRALIPAVVHVDGTARIQTVTQGDGAYYRLIAAFAAESGVPMVLNTSFNGANEPIVEYPRDALAFLRQSGLDVLYIDGWRVTRKE